MGNISTHPLPSPLSCWGCPPVECQRSLRVVSQTRSRHGKHAVHNACLGCSVKYTVFLILGLSEVFKTLEACVVGTAQGGSAAVGRFRACCSRGQGSSSVASSSSHILQTRSCPRLGKPPSLRCQTAHCSPQCSQAVAKVGREGGSGGMGGRKEQRGLWSVTPISSCLSSSRTKGRVLFLAPVGAKETTFLMSAGLRLAHSSLGHT